MVFGRSGTVFEFAAIASSIDSKTYVLIDEALVILYTSITNLLYNVPQSTV